MEGKGEERRGVTGREESSLSTGRIEYGLWVLASALAKSWSLFVCWSKAMIDRDRHSSIVLL